ncbi:MAG: beta-propeller domain-containing protein [Patescibacteria group bacterium]
MDLSQDTSRKKTSSILITMLISLGVVSIAAMLVVSYVSQSPSFSILQRPSAEDNNKLPSFASLVANQGALLTFDSYEKANEYLEDRQDTYYAQPLMRNMAEIETLQAIDSPVEFGLGMPMGDAGGGSKSYSETNVQVSGVDEADLVKTDGEYIYTTLGNQLRIIDAGPDDARIVSTIETPGTAQQLYIQGDKLAVFGYSHREFDADSISIVPRSSFTYFNIYNLSDKENPKLVRELLFEGSYIQSRMIGDYVYFVTQLWPSFVVDIPIPRILENNQPLCTDGVSDSARCPAIHYFDGPIDNASMTTVSAISLTDTDKEVSREVFMLSSSHTLYASPQAMYITSVKYFNEYHLMTEALRAVVEPIAPENIKIKIQKIETADPEVLSNNEKINKINQVIQQYISSLPFDEQDTIEEQTLTEVKRRYEELKPELEQTIIHKITLDKDSIEPTASGSVPGTILNQFSMDEYDGNFRIATTNNSRWLSWSSERTESTNNLYVLDEDLDMIGSITDIAPGESIFSVRFIQDRAYMVTFEQIDPLFVIDVADPTNPTILGELKIPGFSNYLHPYDENVLIGIGQDTTIDQFDRVRTQGVKVSLFDVSDVSNPIEKANYLVGDQSSSQAQYDHKAVLFDKERNLLVIPINAWGTSNPIIPEERYSNNFNGVLVFDITGESIDRRGAIEHKDMGQYQYSQQIMRSLYIDDTLYTLSSAGIKLNDLESLEEKSSIFFEQPQADYPIPLPVEPIFFEDVIF